jgi:hypothetical protein
VAVKRNAKLATPRYGFAHALAASSKVSAYYPAVPRAFVALPLQPSLEGEPMARILIEGNHWLLNGIGLANAMKAWPVHRHRPGKAHRLRLAVGVLDGVTILSFAFHDRSIFAW